MSSIDLTGVSATVGTTSDPTAAAAAQARFSARLTRSGTRTRRDPNDQWSAFAEPLSEAELAGVRRAATDLLDALSYTDIHWTAVNEGYSCDGCGARATCPLVFDSYNTDGDCLMEK